MKILNDFGGLVEVERNGKFVEWLTNDPCDGGAVIISVNFEGITDIDWVYGKQKPKKPRKPKAKKSNKPVFVKTRTH